MLTDALVPPCAISKLYQTILHILCSKMSFCTHYTVCVL